MTSTQGATLVSLVAVGKLAELVLFTDSMNDSTRILPTDLGKTNLSLPVLLRR